MNIDPKFARAFNKAVSNPENIQCNGSIDWNYVDVDVFMDMKPADPSICDTHSHSVHFYNQLDYLIEQYESSVPSRIMQEAAR